MWVPSLQQSAILERPAFVEGSDSLRDGNGGMVLKGETELVGEKHYTLWVLDGWMSMQQWWNGTDRGKLKYWERNIIQCGW